MYLASLFHLQFSWWWPLVWRSHLEELIFVLFFSLYHICMIFYVSIKMQHYDTTFLTLFPLFTEIDCWLMIHFDRAADRVSNFDREPSGRFETLLHAIKSKDSNFQRAKVKLNGFKSWIVYWQNKWNPFSGSEPCKRIVTNICSKVSFNLFL